MQELKNELQKEKQEKEKILGEKNEAEKNLILLEARQEEVRHIAERQKEAFLETKKQMTETFLSLSADALQKNNQSFLELARNSFQNFQGNVREDMERRKQAIDSVVQPLHVSLESVQAQVREMEKSHSNLYVSVREQIKQMAQSQSQLQKETANLVKALRVPNVRGRWGEVQLKRVVEIAGMLEYCDFNLQESVTTEDGMLRPDMVIKLPNNKNIIVDSKAPLQAYLNALETEDEKERKQCLAEHAKQIRNHLHQLSAKSYWEQFPATPEFVVLFLPGEVFFSAALEQDPELIEVGVDKQVILATPTTLIALLKAIAYGWRQERITANAQEISELGKTLYDRIRIMASYFQEMKKGLDRAIDSYNRAVGNFENRIFGTARKFRDLGASVGQDIEVGDPIDRFPRKIRIDENLTLFDEEDNES